MSDPKPDPRHCDECDPSFGCFDGNEDCRKLKHHHRRADYDRYIKDSGILGPKPDPVTEASKAIADGLLDLAEGTRAPAFPNRAKIGRGRDSIQRGIAQALRLILEAGR